MTPKSSLFQTSFSAVFAMALTVQTSPTHAEIVTLVCQQESGSSFTLRVDYDRKSIDLLNPDSSVRHSAVATITEGAVSWFSQDERPDSNGELRFSGSINRLTGQGVMRYMKDYNNTGKYSDISVYGPCRRATQKF